MINHSNYELYIIDYLDGKLSAEDTSALMQFVNNNPSIQAEFNALSSFEPIPTQEEIAGPDFSFLKKPTYKQVKPTYETLLIDNLEGNITTKDAVRLEKALNIYPKLKQDAALFNQTVLKADTQIVFPNKKKLKKAVPLFLPKTFIYYASGIAAAILLIGFLFLYNTKQTNNQLAVNQTNSTKNTIGMVEPTPQEKTEVKTLSVITENSKTNNPKKIKANPLVEEKINTTPIHLHLVQTKELQQLNYNSQLNLKQPLQQFATMHQNNSTPNNSTDNEYQNLKDFMVNKIAQTQVAQKLSLTDSTGGINLAQLAKTFTNNKILSYSPINDEQGNHHGFAIVSKYFSIERIYK